MLRYHRRHSRGPVPLLHPLLAVLSTGHIGVPGSYDTHTHKSSCFESSGVSKTVTKIAVHLTFHFRFKNLI